MRLLFRSPGTERAISIARVKSMIWWVIIGAVIVGALAYGYWSHTRDGRHLARLFNALAVRYGADITPAGLLILPQLRFARSGRLVLVTAMHSSGAQTHDSGPFTLINLELPTDSGQTLRLLRSDANLASAVNRLAEVITPGERAATGQNNFDEAFRIEWSDKGFGVRLLDADLRERLLSSRLPRLDVRLNGAKIAIHFDGIAKSAAEIEEMIDLAMLLADRCSAET